MVALDAADGAIVGYGATVDTGRARHLADLFVRADRQGGGIGGHLLDAVFGDAWPRTTFASDDPRALPLYVRAGMLALLAEPVPGRRPDPASRRTRPRRTTWSRRRSRPWRTSRPAGPASIARPISATGPRCRRSGRSWCAWRSDRGRRRRPQRVPRADALDARGRGRAGADGPAVLLAALGYALAGQELGGACVPGASPLVRRLLDLGFRVRDRDTFLSLGPRRSSTRSGRS